MIYLVTWNYSDKSGWGVVAYSVSRGPAERLCAILKEHGETRQFDVLEVQTLVPPFHSEAVR